MKGVYNENNLTQREQQVSDLKEKSLTNAEIAKKLDISPARVSLLVHKIQRIKEGKIRK